MPGYIKEIPYKPVSETDFSSANQTQSRLDEQEPKTAQKERPKVEEPLAEDKVKFFESISSCGMKPAILSLVPQYSATYVLTISNKLPKPLTPL